MTRARRAPLPFAVCASRGFSHFVRPFGVRAGLGLREALPVFRLLPVAVIAENPDARCGEVLTPANY